VFSAHGVSQEVRRDAEARGLQVYDATCPLVTKVHLEVVKMCKEGFTVLMIGHAGHPEVEGTMGQVGQGIILIEDLEDVAKLNLPADEKVAFVTQTTLSVDETKEIVDALTTKFPHITKPRKQDICYATQNRQDAVKFMAPQVDLVIVVGSKASSNSNRLRELSEKLGVPSYMVDAPEQLEEKWFEGKKTHWLNRRCICTREPGAIDCCAHSRVWSAANPFITWGSGRRYILPTKKLNELSF